MTESESGAVNSILYTIAWVLLLVFLAWPLAWFCVTWWVFLMPFEGLVLVLFKSDVVYTVAEFLESVVKWPRVIGKAICTGSDSFPTPSHELDTAERVSAPSDFTMTKILWTVAWILLLIFVSWPIAYFLGWWWVAIMAFESMIEALVDVDLVLESLVTWPRVLMKAALMQYDHFPMPFANEETTSSHGDYHQHKEEAHERHEKEKHELGDVI